MPINALILTLLTWFIAAPVYGDTTYEKVKVADPYIELHTGPADGYPIFHVTERGEWIEILSRRTEWFKVRTTDGKEGWVNRSQLEQTLTPTGEQAAFKDVALSDFSTRRWEFGLLGGDFDGATVITLYGGYSFTANISGELSLSQVLGSFSDSLLVNANLLGQPFPRWRISPFFTLGTGMIQTNPHATLVQAEDRTDFAGHVGVGFRTYITRRFVFRAEYKNYVVFSSDDENEEPDEWKAGFSVFF